MIPETEMDWLIVVGENVLYGPPRKRCSEFERLGEITIATTLINCDRPTNDLGRGAFYRGPQMVLEEQTPMDTVVIQPTGVQAFGWSSAKDS